MIQVVACEREVRDVAQRANTVQEICYIRCERESLSLHDDVYERVDSFRHDDGQRYVRPNNAGVGVEEGVGVRQVGVQ